jgi:hypothetical protein
MDKIGNNQDIPIKKNKNKNYTCMEDIEIPYFPVLNIKHRQVHHSALLATRPSPLYIAHGDHS